ncbi:MAG: DUF4326 domain-containing protein [Patescibacteria group bacterium]|jgi:hypothetical protein
MKPIRIQRKRTKGWRMPPNTVYVGRPSKWGNPIFTKNYNKTAQQGFREYIGGLLFCDPNYLKELRGKNLCCWCKLSEPCHADVLLELANK